eukprot:15141820-Ditylum_brightwellii.AAC.1
MQHWRVALLSTDSTLGAEPQKEGVLGAVSASVQWRKEARRSSEVCFGSGGGLRGVQVGGHGGATLTLDKDFLNCGRNT